MQYNYDIKPAYKIHFELSEKIGDKDYFFEDTIYTDGDVFDNMTDEQKLAYLNSRFDTWKTIMLQNG